MSPRRWQESAFELWKNAGCKGVVSVVTGGGKTVFAEMCMLNFFRENNDAIFSIIVPTNALLDQWYVSLTEELNVPEDEIGCFSGQERSSKPRRVNLFVINTARDLAPKVVRANANAFLIVDECHRAGSPKNALALRGNYKATLGLSATPEREYDDGFRDSISPVLGDIIYEYTYKEAGRDGTISNFALYNVRTDFFTDEKTEYQRLTRQAAVLFRKLPKEPDAHVKLRHVLQKRASVSASAKMRIPMAAKLVLQNKRERTMVFHERVQAAEALVELLRSKKLSVTIYHSKIAPVVRRDNLRLFRRGEFDVLVSCRALDEGVNVPEASVAIIASSTASVRQRIQRLGRVLRPSAGKAKASIYTIFVTEQEKLRLEKEAEDLAETATTTWMLGRRSINA